MEFVVFTEHLDDFFGVFAGVFQAGAGAGGGGDVEDDVVTDDFGFAHFEGAGFSVDDLGTDAADFFAEFEVF